MGSEMSRVRFRVASRCAVDVEAAGGAEEEGGFATEAIREVAEEGALEVATTAEVGGAVEVAGAVGKSEAASDEGVEGNGGG